MAANQLTLWFASMAYVLICALRRIALAQTALTNTQSAKPHPAQPVGNETFGLVHGQPVHRLKH